MGHKKTSVRSMLLPAMQYTSIAGETDLDNRSKLTTPEFGSRLAAAIAADAQSRKGKPKYIRVWGSWDKVLIPLGLAVNIIPALPCLS